MWVCWSLWTAGAVPVLKLWVSSMWLYQPLPTENRCTWTYAKNRPYCCVRGCVTLGQMLQMFVVCCTLGEQTVLWLRLAWFVVLGGWHNGILFFSLLSSKCIFVLSLCSFSQSKIKTTPKTIHVSVFVWRRPGPLVGSALHRQRDILLHHALRLCHLSKDSFGNAPEWELCSLVFGSTSPDPALCWCADVTDCQHLTLSLLAFLQALCTGTGL